ncbi:MAG: glycosyl transferase [Solirubrobacterales bacterium]|nr:glycosyl transferase [Solirubrobacterales bacterium]
MTLLVAAFGDPGHAFPAIALGRELHRRGHRVVLETWEQWREAVESEGLEFTAAQEYTVFPPPGPDTPDGETAAAAARALARLIDGLKPHLVVSDILTLAPTLAAEVAGVPRVTLIPHVYPVQQPGMPIFSLGLQPPRTFFGRLGWRAWLPLVNAGLRKGRRDMNETRAQLGLAPLERFHGGISEELALVATLPQLEYPREWPAHVEVSGPLFFELPYEDVELPDGEGPLVVIAPSTSQDPKCELLHAALAGLADEPVRVLATTNKHRPIEPIEVPANARLEPWLSYSQAMDVADLVICHGGHGTVARSLAAGVPVLVCPSVGDMAENGARVAWSGAGLSLPRRLLSPRGVRLATRRILGDGAYTARAQELAAWSAAHDGAARAADLVEEEARNTTGRLSPARA